MLQKIDSVFVRELVDSIGPSPLTRKKPSNRFNYPLDKKKSKEAPHETRGGYAPISKDFSRRLTQRIWKNAGNIITAHLLYVRAVQKNKTSYTPKELAKMFYGDKNATSFYKKMAVSQIKNLQKENLHFVEIKEVDNKFVVSFEKQLLESAGNPGEFQLFENDFIKDYEKIFKQKRERLTKIEIGGVLFIAHYILINRNHNFYRNSKTHRIYFRELIECGCFTQRLVKKKQYTIMREIMKNRFKILNTIGFIQGVSYSNDLKPGRGGSGIITWVNAKISKN